MANFEIPTNPNFSTIMRKLETTDPANAALFNALFAQLLENDEAFKVGTAQVGDAKLLSGLTPSEVGQSGARSILKYPYYSDKEKTSYGITFTTNDDGTVSASGTSQSTSQPFYTLSHLDIMLKAGEPYTFASNCTHENGFMVLYFYDKDGNTVTINYDAIRNGVRETYTAWKYCSGFRSGVITNAVTIIPAVDVYISIQIRFKNVDVTITDALFKPMLEHGYIAHPYVPYYSGGAEYSYYSEMASNSDKLGNQDPSYYAKQEEFEVLKKKPYGMLSTENKNYYVDGINGDDSNAGTQTAPFKTFNRFMEEYFKYAEIRCLFIGDCNEYDMTTIETFNSIGMHLVNDSNNENITIHFKGRWTPAFYQSHLNIAGSEDKYITLDIPNDLYFDSGSWTMDYTRITNGYLGMNGGYAINNYCKYTDARLRISGGVGYVRGCEFYGETESCVSCVNGGNLYIRTSFKNYATIIPGEYFNGVIVGFGARINLDCMQTTDIIQKGLHLQSCTVTCNDARLKTWLTDDSEIIYTSFLGTDTMQSPLEKVVENLLPYPHSYTSYEENGLTFTDNGDGSVTVNGTATAGTMYHCKVYNRIPLMLGLEKGKQYTLSGCPKDGSSNTYSMSIAFRKDDDTTLSPRIYDFGNGLTFSIDDYVDNGATKFQVVISVYEGVTMDNVTFYPMLEEGPVAHKYQQYKVSINNSRIATNQLSLKAFPNPIEEPSNSYYDGIYWELSGSDSSGITAYKNVQILRGENYHLEFLTFHKNQANSRTTTYTVTLTKVDDSSLKYVLKKTVKGSYNRVNLGFYASNASGFYTLNIKAEGDDVNIASPSLSFDGIVPAVRKRRIGNVDITSTNNITVNKNKFINGMFIFNLFITADVSTENLAKVNLNTSDENDLSAYVTNTDTYFVGIDHTTKQPVAMCWYHDTSNPGTFLLKVISGIEQDHVYVANGILFMGSNDSVHEITVQEY